MDLPRPQGIMDKVKLLGRLGELDATFPRTVKSGPCQEVVKRDNFSLFNFPILKCWPGDGGRFITWPLVVTNAVESRPLTVGLAIFGAVGLVIAGASMGAVV